MATQSQGIQQLLQAEKRAAEKVAEARKKRTLLLKKAKEEAAHEVEAYKNERERLYKSLEQQTLGSRSVNEDAIKIKTDQMIQEMQVQFERNQEKVLSGIIDAVCNVLPKQHENYVV